MNFSFAAPQWLMLVPIAALAAWQWPVLGLRKPLRLACVLLGALALADPRMGYTGGGMDLWLLMDRSPSTSGVSDPFAETVALLRESRKGANRLNIVEYSTEAAVRMQGDPESPLEYQKGLTRTELAIETALKRSDPRRPTRMLVLTDGYSTESLDMASRALTAAGVPLDYRLTIPPDAADYRVRSVEAPHRVTKGEPVLVEAIVDANRDGTVRAVLRRNTQQIAEVDVDVRQGIGRARFADRPPVPGAFRYTVEIRHPDDSFPGNNTNSTWLEVVAGPRVMLLTAYADDPLPAVLQGLGIDVQTVVMKARMAGLDRGTLAGAKSLILHNVPASWLPNEFLDAAAYAVREQGMGLLMLGGRQSFGTGGYFQSALDELLPVSLESKLEKRKLAVAMSIVMDRSGSMAAGVFGGLTKMDLADKGACAAIQLLGDQDAVAVLAVDSAPYKIVPLTEVGPNRLPILDRTAGIQSQGGGIFVYEGLKAGWEELQRAQVGTRHLILFSDAADSEEPGDYVNLLNEMTSQGATVSVIAMGTDTDADAPLLRDIAARGNGRIFFNNDALSLPQVFAQETVSVARSAFVDQVSPTAAGNAWLEIAARPLQLPKQVDGYNMAYAKPEAALAAWTADEEQSPLVAFWRRGLGRVGAVTFPVAGPRSDSTRNWTGMAEFVQTLVRWLNAPDLPAGLFVRARMDGTRLVVELQHDERWNPTFAASIPRLSLYSSKDPKTATPLPWERLAPGRFEARYDMQAEETVSGAVQFSDLAVPFGPVSNAGGAEWRFDPSRPRELDALATTTGGKRLTSIEEAWRMPDQIRTHSLQGWLALALLVLFVIEIAASRWTNRAAAGSL